jgi:hypothetical protein
MNVCANRSVYYRREPEKFLNRHFLDVIVFAENFMGDEIHTITVSVTDSPARVIRAESYASTHGNLNVTGDLQAGALLAD